MADPENFGGGDFKHKTSKIRMSSPKLRASRKFKQFFRPKSGGLQKKKVFTEIEIDFLAEIGNSNNFFAQNQVVSKKKKKKGFTEIEIEFSAEIGNSNNFFAQNQVVSKKKSLHQN